MEAHKVNKIAIKNAISEYAKKLMVVSEPFSVAYGLGTLDNTMIIDIGAGTVDFCIMHGTVPMEEDQRSILTAGDYVDEQLFKLLTEKHPEADFTVNIDRRFILHTPITQKAPRGGLLCYWWRGRDYSRFALAPSGSPSLRDDVRYELDITTWTRYLHQFTSPFMPWCLKKSNRSKNHNALRYISHRVIVGS